MKTPMQEFIEWIDNYPTEVLTIHKSAVRAKAEAMLEKEEEQLCEHEPLHSATATLDYCPKCGLYQPSK